MSEEHTDTEHEHGGDHSPKHYIKIWAILVVLFLISLVGPEFGNIWITVTTAFGIAFIKAGLVAKHFMHLNVEKPVIHFALWICLAFMVVLFAGVSPDVMKHEGHQWSNEAAKQAVAKGQKKGKNSGHGHHSGEGDKEGHDKEHSKDKSH